MVQPQQFNDPMGEPRGRAQRAVLQLSGSLSHGFRATLTLRDRQGQEVSEAQAALPANVALGETLSQWQASYRQTLTGSRLGPITVEVEPGSLAQHEQACKTCRLLGDRLQQQFTLWLGSAAFRPIDQQLREALTPQVETQILLRSEATQLHHLPWHHWDVVERYPLTEVIFGSQPQRVEVSPGNTSTAVRVLAILGDRQNIDVSIDRQLLEDLPQAKVTFLVEPSRKTVEQALWEQPWDIFFFAGHSTSEIGQGQIAINRDENLTLDELRYGLRRAIRSGLQLAIFNSCDGLGLAYALEALHLPQLIVMREPVADRVAQEFLNYFLQGFARGESLPLALREARERLQSLESHFPWATWLPVLFQNPAAIAPTWNSLRGVTASSAKPSPHPPRQQSRFSFPLGWLTALPKSTTQALGIGATLGLLLLGGRSLGWLEPMELALFDQLLRSRPSEPEDNRIVVLEVTDADIESQSETERQGRSLSDQTLNQLLNTLSTANPAVIALDIYREESTALAPLQQQFAQNPKLITVCKGQDPIRDIPGIAPPPQSPPERLGFSDVQDDRDGVVRLHLLSALPQTNSPCPTDFSLSAAIAEQYLYNQGLNLSFPDAHNWQWGQTQFQRIGRSWLKHNRSYSAYGPYAQLNTQGHKLLLNYRAHRLDPSQPNQPNLAFLRVSLGKVLSGEVPPSHFNDKIVLIGVNATQSEDHWTTPYRDHQGDPLTIAGVYLQAQMTSQLLSAVLDGRLLLHCLAWPLEGLGLLLLGAGGAASMQQWRSGLIRLFLGIGILVGSGWLLLVTQGLYLPLCPWLLAWGAGNLGGGLYRKRQVSLNISPPADSAA